jgi:C-terminal processing protease CtpA/Prc
MPQRKAFLGMQGKASQRYSSGFGFANSTFAKLKVQKGDVIQSVNGIPTIKMDDYVAAAVQSVPTIKLKWFFCAVKNRLRPKPRRL